MACECRIESGLASKKTPGKLCQVINLRTAQNICHWPSHRERQWIRVQPVYEDAHTHTHTPPMTAAGCSEPPLRARYWCVSAHLRGHIWWIRVGNGDENSCVTFEMHLCCMSRLIRVVHEHDVWVVFWHLLDAVSYALSWGVHGLRTLPTAQQPDRETLIISPPSSPAYTVPAALKVACWNHNFFCN